MTELEMEKDEAYWEQRARVNWLKVDDRSTNFFHNYATQRRRSNTIKCLENEDRRVTKVGAEMEEIEKHFSGIFLLRKMMSLIGSTFYRELRDASLMMITSF